MSSIESKLEQIEQTIRKTIEEKKNLKGTARTFAIIGGICVAGLVLAKAPVFLIGAAVGGAGFVVSSYFHGRKEDSLNAMYQTQASLLIAQEAGRKADEPSPANDLTSKGIKQGFGQKAADPVEKLAEDVEALKKTVEGKPVELDKRKSTFGRFTQKK
jgi:hypothetical protein